ncbi:MAG: hypothetical protein O7I42_13465 [Alphaproteobacteria bacterium]|nr:hypothetical protein [Alphaproteobacteria bacterium]
MPSDKIARFLAEMQPPTSYLVVDLDVLAENYQRLQTPHDGKPTGPVVLAWPTCDEVEILYEEAGYELPLDLAIGDQVDILSAGAYTVSWASVGFNGFPPMKQYFV